MSNPTSAADALRDLFRAHARPHVWLPALLVLVAACAIALHVRHHDRPTRRRLCAAGVPLPVAFEAVLCWMVSTLCAYVGGFILGRVYQP